jgi:hypothetical protein
MLCSTWKGGSFGIRVGNANAQKYFQKKWTEIEVIIDGKHHFFDLTKTFWTTCHEFRGKEIGIWLRKHGLDRWPKGRPHKVKLISLGSNKFKLLK